MSAKRSQLRNWLEFLPAWLLLKSLGLLPRRAAILAGQLIAGAAYYLCADLRRTGYRNLELAMPELDLGGRRRIIKGAFRNLGRLLGEFSQFPKLDARAISQIVVYDGFENYAAALKRRRGVLFLTGHFGAWELCAFAHGAYGHPLNFLARPLDNPLLDRLVNRYRKLSGNRVIDKNDAARAVLEALRRGQAVGFLIDINVVREEGVFCDFFGVPACSSTSLAIFALRTGAPVVPGFLIWDERIEKHRLRFEPELEIIKTGDFKRDVHLNTARFNQVIEEYVRRHPDHWLWIHKRWKTRPAGATELYGPPRK